MIRKFGPISQFGDFRSTTDGFAWVSVSIHACDLVPLVMRLRLAALRAVGAPL